MYTLQKPDFEVLLLAELQRQQRCKHLCDVLLKAKGINTNNSFCFVVLFAQNCMFSLFCPMYK